MAIPSQERVYANARDVSYSEVACVTVLTWDVLTMYSQEVRVLARDYIPLCLTN